MSTRFERTDNGPGPFGTLIHTAAAEIDPKSRMLAVMLLVNEVIEEDDPEDRAVDGAGLRSAIAATFEHFDPEAWQTANDEYDRMLDE
jgi:hypothetical protein